MTETRQRLPRFGPVWVTGGGHRARRGPGRRRLGDADPGSRLRLWFR